MQDRKKIYSEQLLQIHTDYAKICKRVSDDCYKRLLSERRV